MIKFGGYLLILIMLLGIVSGTILASEQTAVQSETTATLSNTSNTNAASVTGDIEQSTALGHHEGGHHGHHGPGPDIHIGLDGGPETAILLLATLFILVLFL